jgi:2,5-furandicarboxylate decarboxylase 1
MDPSFGSPAPVEAVAATGRPAEAKGAPHEGTGTDLRWFIEALRGEGLLVDVRRSVSLDRELGAVLRACEKDGKAALFHSIEGHSTPVVGGALGSRRGAAVALRCAVDELFDRVRTATESPTAPRVVADAPSQQRAHDPVDLTRLPVPVHAPGDSGAFINAGVVIARDPNTGRHNLSFNRMQIFDETTAGMNMNTWRDMDEFLRRAEEQGHGLPFAVAIGVDPVLLMAAAFRYDDGDEYEIAGALRGAGISVVPARTVDLLVPAEAEFVLEGEIIAGDRREEGPMAEFTGHYSGTRPQPIAKVHAITHRDDPIYQTIAGASSEHLLLGASLMREPRLHSTVRLMSPRVVDVRLPGSGFAAYVSLADPRAGEARSVAIAALSFHANTKCVIVVDDDIDLDDPADMMWALATRVRWERDCTTIPGALGNPLDPSSDSDSVQTKVIIDATIGPERRGDYQKVIYPSVDLRQYLEP